MPNSSMQNNSEIDCDFILSNYRLINCILKLKQYVGHGKISVRGKMLRHRKALRDRRLGQYQCLLYQFIHWREIIKQTV